MMVETFTKMIIKVLDYIKMLNSLFLRDVLTNSTIPLSKIILINQKIYIKITLDQVNKTAILTQRSIDVYGIKSIQHKSALTNFKKKQITIFWKNFDMKQKSTLLIIS